MEPLIFVTAVINGALLSAVFAAQIAGRRRLMRGLGIAYLCLAAPAAAALYMAAAGGAKAETIIFLAIYLAYLFIEWLYDYSLKLDFRYNWKLLIPYAALYIAACYGLFVLAWRQSITRGSIVLTLTLLQLALNMLSHFGKRRGGQTQ